MADGFATAFLVLRLWHFVSDSVPEMKPWRLVEHIDLHVGARPAALVSNDETAGAVTIQVRCGLCGILP